MKFPSHLLVPASFILLTAGCTVTTTPKDDSFGGKDFMAPPAETTALYESAPAPTKATLRGTWRATDRATSTGANADVRFRFDDGKIIGGARCGDVTTGGVNTAAKVVGLDASTGTRTLDNAFFFTRSTNGQSCGGGLNTGEWTFEVKGTTLTFKSEGSSTTETYEKVAD